MQYPQPLQMSSCTSTVPCSVRISDPVGQTSRQAAWVQCLQTSEDISQRTSVASSRSTPGCTAPGSSMAGIPRSTGAESRAGTRCSTNATCRYVLAPSPPLLS
ncbi:hypothetical protein GCM10010472_47330 [Pseudonocardia halophobica]